MPKTKFQGVIFTLIMAFFMVFCMTVYVTAINTNTFDYSTFEYAIKHMWIEYVIVFILINFIITKQAQKVTFKIFKPGKDAPIFIGLGVQAFTVMYTVPAITLISLIIHNGFTSDLFIDWIVLIVRCFPMALCLQVFLVGPFVRKIFRTIFAKQLVTKQA
jgi:hypothetical protein